jgi:hypothetical protein
VQAWRSGVCIWDGFILSTTMIELLLFLSAAVGAVIVEASSAKGVVTVAVLVIVDSKGMIKLLLSKEEDAVVARSDCTTVDPSIWGAFFSSP